MYLNSFLSMVVISRYFCYYKVITKIFEHISWHSIASVSIETIPIHRIAGSESVTIFQFDEY